MVTLVNDKNGKKQKFKLNVAESVLRKGEELKARAKLYGKDITYWSLPESSAYFYDNGSLIKKPKKGE